MWTIDFPDRDPDADYPEPTVRQRVYADQAEAELRQLRSTLERLTVPQQRAIIAKLGGSVYRGAILDAGDITPSLDKVPEHESEAQALTEAAENEP